MLEHNPNELELLIEGFLNGELSDSESRRLAGLIESDPAAARAFDAALHTEALLRSAHAERAVPARIHKMAEHALARRENPFAIPVRTWVGVAAMLILSVTAVLCYKYIPRNSESAPGATFTVAAGRVWVDGSEPRVVSENQWVNVSPDGPARFKSQAGNEIELDANTGALLRKDGAKLLNGSGTFNVKSGSPEFKLETQQGTVRSSAGEFTVKLQTPSSSIKQGDPKMNTKKIGAALLVTVLAGTAQVEVAGKSFPRLTAGMSRAYGDEIDGNPNPPSPNPNQGPGPGPRPPMMPPPPDCGLVSRVLDHAKDLALSDDQNKALAAIRAEVQERRAAFEKDEKLRILHDNLNAAFDAQNGPAVHDLRDAIRERENEILKTFPPGHNPMEVLTDAQRDQMHQILEQLGPPPNGMRRDGPPPPTPNGENGPPDGPRPPKPPLGDDGRPMPPLGNDGRPLPPRDGFQPPNGPRRDGPPGQPQGNDGRPLPPRDGFQPPNGGPGPNGPRPRPPFGDGQMQPPRDGQQPPPDGPRPPRGPQNGNGPQQPNNPPPPRGPDVQYLLDHADELKLTDEQKAKLKDLLNNPPQQQPPPPPPNDQK